MNQIFNIYYINGLDYKSSSEHFKTLNEKYENILYMDWNDTTDFDKFINKFIGVITEKAKSNNQSNVIISYGIGSNIAIQIQKKLHKLGLGLSMIHINPMFTIKQINIQNNIPNNILGVIKNQKKITDSLVILGESDAIINHNIIPKKVLLHNTFIEVLENTHKLEDLKECFDDIDLYIVSRYFNN